MAASVSSAEGLNVKTCNILVQVTVLILRKI